MSGVTVTKQIHFSMRNRGRREIREGPKPVPEVTDEGRVPRVSRLMALAIKINGLIESGAIADQAEAARLGHVTRARMTQIMNLLLLAPDIQEDILHLPRVRRGRDPIVESHLRPITQERCWDRQRWMWRHLTRATPQFWGLLSMLCKTCQYQSNTNNRDMIWSVQTPGEPHLGSQWRPEYDKTVPPSIQSPRSAS